jgi:hypothetical protein
MLTDAQVTDVRRFAGYQLAGVPTPTSNNDLAYLVVGMRQMSLVERLSTLSAAEETVLTTIYLTNLTTLEAAIVAAASNLDTEQAAVWTRNKDEIADRDRLFDSWRRRMCAFLGFAPGPGLSGSSAQVNLMRA